jgi:hypothetical protein
MYPTRKKTRMAMPCGIKDSKSFLKFIIAK